MASQLLADIASLVPKEVIDGLDATYGFWRTLDFTYLFIGHCLFCAMAVPQLRDRFMVHYILTFLWGNGGGLTTALLLMAPHHAKLSIFTSNEIVGIWTVCWWIVNYFPGGVPYTFLDKWYIKVFVKSCTALLRALLIVGRVDLAIKLYPGIVAAPLLLGTLAGCGGRLIADALLHGYAEMPGLAELTSPGFVSRSAFMAATTYYLLGYVLQLLPPSAAAGLVVTTLMVHSFATELTGRHLDFTQPIAEVLHTLTRIDPPPRQPAHRPATRQQTVAAEGGTPAAKAEATPAGSPAKAKTPVKPTPATVPDSLPDAKAAGPSTAVTTADNNTCEVAASPVKAFGSVIKVARPAKDAEDVVKAAALGLPAEGSLAAARPRRSTRRSAAVA